MRDRYPTSGIGGPDLTDWHCPGDGCGAVNTDLVHQMSYCPHCGQVVWVGSDEIGVFDEGWKMDIEALKDHE